MHYSRMTIDELYGRAGEVKRFITYLENKGAHRSVEDERMLKGNRAVMREIKKEIKRRVVQLPLL